MVVKVSLSDPLFADQGMAQTRSDAGWHTRHRSSTSGQELWQKARKKVCHINTVKKQLLRLQGLAKDTAFMRSKTAKERERLVLKIMVVIVTTGAATAMTKSALFHMKAAGEWDNGQEYVFGYALSLTLIVFLLKVGLVFLHRSHEHDHHEDGSKEDAEVLAGDVENGSLLQRISDALMPWVLLVSFTFFEMLSATVASMGLLYGAPMSVFVVFKSAKTVFLAIMSVVFLRVRLNLAQWSALLLITLALVMATLAEGNDKKGTEEVNLKGPGLLLLSEFFHGLMLILQEVSVKHYWSDPLQLLSVSAVIGILMTLATMYQVRDVWISLPDGGKRPASDIHDSLYMCWVNPLLGLCWLTHLFVHVSQDVAHVVILKHISALARTLCDSVKLILMWSLGKGFWLLGILPVLAEPWHPGLIGSWLMLPAILIIIYSMLMFKNGVFHVFRKTDQGMEADLALNKASVKVDIDEPFFVSMFTSKKLKKLMHQRSTPLYKSSKSVPVFADLLDGHGHVADQRTRVVSS